MKTGLLKNKDAVSSVVTAILLLSVITTFIAAINSYYIPSLVADHEIHHMQDVRNSFMEIAASASPGSSKERVLVPLGDGGMPFISSLSSSGTLTVSPDKGKIEITMENAHSQEGFVKYIKYSDLPSNGIINDIISLSHLTLEVKNEGTCKVTINGGDWISVSTTNSGGLVQATIRTSKGANIVLLSSSSVYSLDLLDPVYGFDDIINDQTSEFDLSFSLNDGHDYFDVGYFIVSATTENPPAISSNGKLCYKSSNNQWIEQDYIFENGAVILNQGSNSIIKSQPFFNIDKKDIELCLFDITSADASIGGNGVAIVNVFGSEGDEYEYRDVGTTTIKVTSNYTEAWEDYFKRKGSNPTKDPNKWVEATFYNRNVSITTSDVDIVLPK